MATGPGSNSVTGVSHSSTGGGYTCATCGTWVTGGYYHYCPGYNPAPYGSGWPTVYYQQVNMQPVIEALEKLTKAVEELRDIIASDK